MKKIFTKAALTGATAIIIYLMATNFILHMFTNRQYGLFFDEYYYYSMSGHLAFGYMDVPPVTGWLMALSRLLMGDSITAMHVLPALAGSFAMLFAALTARKMGGGRFSHGLQPLR
jgi:4-amino-4-deoxy-L-arabinose transferase-like glycosyltransferase